MTADRHRPLARLTRLFLGRCFDFGFLSAAAAESFKRLLIGISALFISIGLLLVRVYMYKYGALNAANTAGPFRAAVLADHAFLIAVPMWIGAFVTVLAGHSLFPDETDFRVLSALPITRRLIFGAKLLALVWFTSLFIGFAQAGLLPLFLLTSFGRWVEGPFVIRAFAYGAATLLASAFAVLAVVAIHGLLLVFAVRGRLQTISAALRSVLVCGLVLSLPFVARLPADARMFAEGAWSLVYVPPAWFVGLERWLMGDLRPHLVQLAEVAVAASAGAALVAVLSYAALYLHFDRLIITRRRPAAPAGRDAVRHVRFRWPVHPVGAAVWRFTVLTLRRSALHQGVTVALAALGAGLVLNSLIGANVSGFLAGGGAAPARLRASVVWAPFVLIFGASLAARTALLLPIEQRANWIFRMTEDASTRARELNAAFRALLWLGVFVPVALMSPLQFMVLGLTSVITLFVTSLAGWLFVELLLQDWERIPFTSAYVPGKGFVPQMLLKALLAFVLFTTFGGGLAQGTSVVGGKFLWTLNACVAAAAFMLGRRRRALWHGRPLAFDDAVPSEVNPLRLSVD